MAEAKLPGARAAKYAAWKKHIRSLQIGIGIGLVCGLAVILLGAPEKGIVARTEFLTVDFRYRARPPIPVHPGVGLIDYDDASLALFGGWPWPRHRQVALVTMMDYYDARAAGYDVFFSENNDIVLMDQRLKQFIHDTSSVAGPAAADRAMRTLKTVIRDYDMEFQRVIAHAGNIYLGYFVQEPDKSIAAGGLPRIRQYIEEDKKTWTDQKRGAMESIEAMTIPATPVLEKSIFKMSDVVPPLPQLARASSGAGFAQIVSDFDHTVRLYPMFMYYDGRISPSIGCVMLSRLLDAPIDSWNIVPGEYVEIPGARLPDSDTRAAIRIPVNENGQMLMNWAGKFDDVFLHVPFRLISEYYAYYTAKHIARQYAPEPENFASIYREIVSSVDEEQMVTEAECHRLADEITLAYLATPLLRAGKSHADILAMLTPRTRVENAGHGGSSAERDRDVWRSAAETILKSVDLALRAADTSAPAKKSGAPSVAGDFDPAWQKEIERNVAWFQAKGRLEEAEPLFFPPTRQVQWSGRRQDFSPLDIENKIFMIGLTGVGTIDLNPMPYESVSPMVGLHSNALNTILVKSFLRFPKQKWKYPLDLGFALATSVVGALSTPFIGFLAVLMMISAYSYAVYWAFAAHGQWIYWVEPVMSILLTFTAVVVFHFIQAAREKGKVRAIFATMVSPDVLKLMEENPDRFSLTGVRKPATTFFSAIEKFGKVTAGVAPDELGGILSQYLTPTSEIIMDYRGYIDKYEGHIIMADFGVPLDDPGHAWKCCYASLEQQQDIDAFIFFVKARYGADVFVTMGVNSGYISAGNMGSEKKMQYTVMGDAVNMAARFRPANLIYDTRIIAGEPTLPYVKDYLDIRMLDKLLAKGKTKPTTIYEIQGWRPEAYLSLKQSEPIPPSLLTRWSKCPAEKIFGYQRFWIQKEKDFTHPLIPKIREFFESRMPLAEELIKMQGRFEIQKYHTELTAVREEASRLLGQSVDGENASSGSWDAILDKWLSSSRTLVEALENKRYLAEMMTAENFAVFEATFSRSATLANKLQTLKTRLTFHSETESVMERFLVDLHEAVEQTADPSRAAAPVNEEEIEAKRHEYRGLVESFYQSLAANAREYHEMMSVVGSITDNQKKARELFVEGVNLHWERKWDEAIRKFRGVLELLPKDGPARSYIERVEGYKVDPPGPKWQGEFVQKKK